MKTIEASGHIDKGKLKIYNEHVFKQHIQEIGFVNHVRLKVEYGNKRTLDQNAYLWGAVVQAVQVRYLQEGYDYSPGEVYRLLENSFCKMDRRNEKTNVLHTVVVPFKELTTDQFEEIVIGRIREWIQDELEVYVKLPHEYYGMSLDAYDQWKRGEINKTEAMKMSMSPEKLTTP